MSGVDWRKKAVMTTLMPLLVLFMIIGQMVLGSPATRMPSEVQVATSEGWASGTGYCTWGGTGDDSGYGVAVAADGSVYLAGSTPVGYNYVAFLTKYTASGTQLWNRTWIGTGGSSGWGVTVADDGSVYLAGSTANYGVVYTDAFLVKYTTGGTQLWSRTWGGANYESGHGVAVAADGSVYMAGYTESFGAGYSDAFLVKYATDGTQLWNRTWGGIYNDLGYGVAVVADGSVYLAGNTDSFGAGNSDAFFVKYNTNGSQIWSRTWGGASYDSGKSIAVAANGSVYLAGLTRSFGAGGNDAFLVKYTDNGTLLWRRTWGGAGGTSEDRGYGVAVAIDGSAYMAGYTDSFGAGGIDAFLVKYSDNGSQLWNRTWGGVKSEEGFFVAAGVDGSAYVVGNTDSFRAGNVDAFIVKYASTGHLLLTVSNPEEISFTEGETGNVIPWIVIGSTSGSCQYTIFSNGTPVDSSYWVSGQPISYNLNGLLEGSYNFTVVATDGYGEWARDSVIVSVNASPVVPNDPGYVATAMAMLIIGLVASICIITVVKLRPKLKKMREVNVTRQEVSGKVEEVVYRNPQQPPLQVQAASPAIVTCKSCGLPVPKGGERGRFCVFCGKALA